MKLIFAAIFAALVLFAQVADARGGFSYSGGRGGFSSSGSSARSYSTAPSRTTTTTTTTRTYSSSYVHPYGGCCGGMGMGYGYSNGLITGLIIGEMMHPANTVVYTGGGAYSNNALLYPDGRVVNQQGYLVGTYTNGTFTAIQNGPMVAQPVPQDAGMQQAPPRPIVVEDESEGLQIAIVILLIIVVCLLGFIFLERF